MLPTPDAAIKRLTTLRLPPLPTPSLSWFHWSGWYWHKLAGVAVAALAVAGVVWLHTDTHWFVYADTVAFESVSYLTPEELYPADALEGWSIFWLQPETVRQQVVAHPYVADAQVRVQLPNRVAIAVVEEGPTAIWITDDGPMWLLADGTALPIPVRTDQPVEAQLLDAQGAPLPILVDVQRSATSVKADHLAVDPDILASTLALIAATPGLERVRYNTGVGLNFALPGTDYWIYWGDGRDLETKQNNLRLSLDLLAAGEVDGQVIDVRYVNHPIVR